MVFRPQLQCLHHHKTCILETSFAQSVGIDSVRLLYEEDFLMGLSPFCRTSGKQCHVLCRSLLRALSRKQASPGKTFHFSSEALSYSRSSKVTCPPMLRLYSRLRATLFHSFILLTLDSLIEQITFTKLLGLPMFLGRVNTEIAHFYKFSHFFLPLVGA